MSLEHRYALTRGYRLNEYRIVQFLGAGAFGITYLAVDENLRRRVAIKEYFPADSAMRDVDDSVAVRSKREESDFLWGLRRFAEEARSLARFRHPSIVAVYDYFTAHGTGYLVMEYVEGESLGELLRRNGTLAEADIGQSVLPVLAGLDEVHRAGLLHRDIKPSNIVLRNDGTPVLIDFGAARHAIGAKSRSGTSLVTPGFSPLEQYSTTGHQAPASDLYAFCAVLYRCVTGRAPPDATDRSLGTEGVSALKAAESGYSGALLKGIEAGLALRIEDRPQDVGELRGLLARDAGGLDPAVRRNTVHGAESRASQQDRARNEERSQSAGATDIVGISGKIANDEPIGHGGRRAGDTDADGCPADEHAKGPTGLIAVVIAGVSHTPSAMSDPGAAVFACAIWGLGLWAVLAMIDRHARKAPRVHRFRPRIAMGWAMIPLCLLSVVGALQPDELRPLVDAHPLVDAARSAEEHWAVPVDPAFEGTFGARVAGSLGSAAQLLFAGLFGGGAAMLANRILRRRRVASGLGRHSESAAVGLLAGTCFLGIVFAGIFALFG